jgi:site-specific recombinase XerD
VSRLHDYLTAAGMPTAVASITREHVESFMADQLDRLKASSARSRYASLRQFFRWCQDEGEIPSSPMARMRPPAVPEQPVPVLGEEELRTLVRTTEWDSTFYGRRDAAVLRVLSTAVLDWPRSPLYRSRT